MRFPAADHVLSRRGKGVREESGDQAFSQSETRVLKITTLCTHGDHGHLASKRPTRHVTEGDRLENELVHTGGEGRSGGGGGLKAKGRAMKPGTARRGGPQRGDPGCEPAPLVDRQLCPLSTL